MADAIPLTLHALSSETVTGSGARQQLAGLHSAVDLQLVISTVTALLTVTVETSADGVSGWVPIGAFDPATDPMRQRRVFAGCDAFVRCSWDGSGTFALSGAQHVLYAGLEDLHAELPQAAISDLPEHVQAKHLLSASNDAEDAIAMTRPMPLASWPESVTMRCAQIAAWRCLTARGVDTESTADRIVKETYDEARAWLDNVARDKLRPPGLAPATAMGAKVEDAAPVTTTVQPVRVRFSDDWGDFG